MESESEQDRSFLPLTIIDSIKFLFSNLGLAEPPCLHHWRPACLRGYSTLRREGVPARHCDLCKHTEQLTKAEFYAQFGQYFDELRENLRVHEPNIRRR